MQAPPEAHVDVRVAEHVISFWRPIRLHGPIALQHRVLRRHVRRDCRLSVLPRLLRVRVLRRRVLGPPPRMPAVRRRLRPRLVEQAVAQSQARNGSVWVHSIANDCRRRLGGVVEERGAQMDV